MASRTSNGSKVVVAAVTMIVATLGVGTVYLPFIADRDKIRGLNEEAELSVLSRREYERALLEMEHSTTIAQESQSPAMHTGNSNEATQQNSILQSNSMWSRINQASGKK